MLEIEIQKALVLFGVKQINEDMTPEIRSIYKHLALMRCRHCVVFFIQVDCFYNADQTRSIFLARLVLMMHHPLKLVEIFSRQPVHIRVQ